MTDDPQISDCLFPGGKLPVADGPWNEDIWLIERPARHVTSGTQPCAVSTCGLPAGRAEGDRERATDILCIAHRRRLQKRTGATKEVQKFIAEQESANPILAPRGSSNHQAYLPPIEFWRASPRLANELRFVTATKIRRRHWQNPVYVAQVLRGAIKFSARTGATSLTEFKSAALRHQVSIPRCTRDALDSMLALLKLAHPDPWENDVWHPADLGITEQSAAVRSGAKLGWEQVTCAWLRTGLKRLAKARLQAGTVAWSTLGRYVRGGSLLSAFMAETGPIPPEELTRAVYLEFTAWVRDESTSRSDVGVVTSLARHLADMRDDGIEPALPDVVFLRRGENPNPKVRKPKPFPADTLAAIDGLIADESADFPADTRLMLRVFRAACPRPSEVMSLPPDCIEHNGFGYSLRYYQSKIDDWRVVPLPPRLGSDLAAQAVKVRDAYGGQSDLLFPYSPPVLRTNTLLPAPHVPIEPWTYGRFSRVIWALYQEHGIGDSSVTGERMTGAQLHRFRHSTATALLAEGWSQYEVQQFLGHRSPTMMQSYAEINDEDQHQRYVEFVRQNVDINGLHRDVNIDAAATTERLRDLLVRASLPNGYCTLPEKQTCDFLPNPCLSCTFFRTTPTYLPIHIRQRDDSLRELKLARSQGRERAAQVHERTANTLTQIIESLNAEPDRS